MESLANYSIGFKSFMTYDGNCWLDSSVPTDLMRFVVYGISKCVDEDGVFSPTFTYIVIDTELKYFHIGLNPYIVPQALKPYAASIARLWEMLPDEEQNKACYDFPEEIVRSLVKGVIVDVA